MPASSSFHSENSGKALPSLYAQQSPCLYPAHSSLFPGNQTQLLPGRLLSSVRSLMGNRCSIPQPSLPSPQQATLSGNPCCQYLACAWCPSLGENLVTPGELPNFWGAQNLLDLHICPPCYLMENTRACNAQHLGSALLRELQSPSLGKGPLCTDWPRRLRVYPPHLCTTSVGSAPF